MAQGGTTADNAKDLLNVVPFIWVLLTAVLLGPSVKFSSETERYHLGRSVAAVVLSVLSALVSGVLVVVMAPVGLDALKNTGAIQGVLVLYEVILLAVIGVTVWSIVVAIRAGRHLRHVIRG